MRRLALLALTAAAAAAAGCEVLVGIHDKTQAADAADSTDATGPSDGASDAEDPSVSCTKQPPGFIFCDDFDSEQEAGDGWEWDTPQGDSAITLDTANPRTPPASVQVVAPPDAPEAQLGVTMPQALTSGFRLAFDLYLDMGDVSGLPQVGVAQVLTAGNPPLQFDYQLGNGDTCMLVVWNTQTQQEVIADEIQFPPLQQWTRIVMAYDASTQGVTVIEDGKTLEHATVPGGAAPGTTRLILGAVYVNQPGNMPFQAEFDDVVMRGN